MLFNYLKTAWRSLIRHRLYSILNLLGLSVSMGCVLLIALYITNELRFDAFHPHAERVYRVLEHQPSAEEGDRRLASVSFNTADVAREQIPEVELTTKLASLGRRTVRNPDNQQAYYRELIFAQPSIFKIFHLPLAEGNPETALTEPGSVVLTHNLAQKLFGSDNPVGKIITQGGEEVRVTGVLAPIPANTHIRLFEVLTSYATLKNYSWYERVSRSDWSSNHWSTYYRLKPEAAPSSVEAKLTSLIQERVRTTSKEPYNSSFHLQPLRDIHFYSAGIESDQNFGKTRIEFIYLFGAIGLFILLLACINYMNLITARTANYGKEVSIRKIVGANRLNLALRFFSETIILTLLAFTLAVSLVNLALPAFNTFTGKTIYLADFVSYLGVMAAILLATGLIAGSYPALYLSSFRPLEALKEKSRQSQTQFNLRRGLVVFQFCLSTVLIIGTLIGFSQLRYVQQKPLGFNQEALMVIDINSGKVRQGFQTIKEEYERVEGVKSVSVSSRVPGEWKILPKVVIEAPEQKAGTMEAYFMGGDADFLNTFQIELIDGRNFDSGRPADSTAVLLNEQAARMLGVQSSDNQLFTFPAMLWEGARHELEPPFQINVIGIVKDFHFQSLHDPLRPLIIGYRNNPLHNIDYFTVRLENAAQPAPINQLTEILQRVDPNQLFEYHYLDSQMATFYEEDRRRTHLVSLATGFGIFIACLGLFGLAAYTAEQRTKEIGIRKVIGASVWNIVRLLSREYLSLVVISLLIALPIAMIGARRLLDSFAYRVDLQWWMFVIPGLAALMIALLTVSFQSIRAALINPVEALRDE